MNLDRAEEILKGYDRLKIAIVGDFCLDRYFEIDPARSEISIETGLEVYNVTRVRTQAGAAGTILNNLVTLGIPEIHAIGFCGEDAEGWLLQKALGTLEGVQTNHFIKTQQRATFTYSKPLVCKPNQPPVEKNRLDQKNWTPTPTEVSKQICKSLEELIPSVDALIIMDQVDIEDTGVITKEVLSQLGSMQKAFPEKLMIADSRRGLKSYPHLTYKMNLNELSTWKGLEEATPDHIRQEALKITQQTGHKIFVSMADQGIIGMDSDGSHAHAPSLPIRGPIDIVGAGDSVTANLCAALAAGATMEESLQLSMLAASCVIHQLGTTGTASTTDLLKLAKKEKSEGNQVIRLITSA